MVTSPPYWGLRDYGTGSWEGGRDPKCEHKVRLNHDAAGTSTLTRSKETVHHAKEGFKDHCPRCGARRIDQQLGSEPTVQEYVGKLVAIFRELRRVLRDNGTVWLNLGDSYSSGGASHTGRQDNQPNVGARRVFSGDGGDVRRRPLPDGNLVGVPWRVAFALQEDGWVLRQDIIYSKPSPMPESVTNRCTKAHEYIFLLTKGRDYFYDAEAIKEESSGDSGWAKQREKGVDTWKYNATPEREKVTGQNTNASTFGGLGTRNKRSVWTVSHGGGYQGAHFATYPPALIEPCILAGTSEHGCCPRCGASWERVVGKGRVSTRPGQNSKVNRKREELKINSTPGQSQCGSSSTLGNVVGNRDPERHVTDTRTLGWRPGCKCYGLELIGDPPSEPNKGPKETEPDFQARYASWRAKQTEWEARWKALKPAYDRAWDPDDDGEGAGAVPCVVLDPFIGSGTTALVCLDKGRACWGIDLSKEYLDRHAVERCRGNLLSRPLLAKLAGPRPQGVQAP